MRHPDRSRNRARTVTFAALFVFVALGGSAHASAIRGSADPRTALERFQFDFSTTVSRANGTEHHELRVETSGVYVAPRDQECRATVTIGDFEVTQRAVVIGDKVWVGTGGRLDRTARREWDFASLCPSDPAFWQDLDVPVDAIGILPGDDSTLDGRKVRHHDLSALLGDVLSSASFTDVVPAGFQIEQLEVWISRRGGWVAGIEMKTIGNTDDVCRDMTSGAVDDIAAPCAVSTSLRVTRANDPDVRVTH
jgi:hypothetical protein